MRAGWTASGRLARAADLGCRADLPVKAYNARLHVQVSKFRSKVRF